MSTKELNRIFVMEKVCKKELKLYKAAEMLKISFRQAIRLKKQFERDGAKGLVSGKVGAPSNNQLPQEKKELITRW